LLISTFSIHESGCENEVGPLYKFIATPAAPCNHCASLYQPWTNNTFAQIAATMALGRETTTNYHLLFETLAQIAATITSCLKHWRR